MHPLIFMVSYSSTCFAVSPQSVLVRAGSCVLLIDAPERSLEHSEKSTSDS